MENTRPLTAKQQASLDESWSEVGESMAAAVLVGGITPAEAWKMLKPSGLYRRWMLDKWIERYRLEHPELGEAPQPSSKGRKRPKTNPSKFTKREQIHEALRLLYLQNER